MTESANKKKRKNEYEIIIRERCTINNKMINNKSFVNIVVKLLFNVFMVQFKY